MLFSLSEFLKRMIKRLRIPNSAIGQICLVIKNLINRAGMKANYIHTDINNMLK
jgi:hypothetical protein